jgi:hypothetical protein
MRARTFVKFAVIVAAAVSLASCSTGRTADTRRGVTDAAYIPLRDVNLIRPEIPLVLRNLQYPYSTGTLVDCTAVIRELGQLDAVLGPATRPKI